MILFLTSGLISVSVTVLTVAVLMSRLRPMTVNVIQYTDVLKSSSLTVPKIPKPFLEVIVAERRLLVRYQSLTFAQEGTLTGIKDISGLGQLWAVCSPTISLKVLRSLPSHSKSGSLKTVLSKLERITKEQK